jgi:ATP-dependent helicase HrpB
LAARLAARRVAEERSERIGETVGYQVRFEQAGGPITRLWYVTEGVLTRKLLSGRPLEGASVVILDEFHERHLETDLALALLRHRQRHDQRLRILLMSATLDVGALANQLGGAAIVNAPGRMFPVSVRYKPHSSEPLEEQVASAVSEAVAETGGHTLVFLPGAAEIRRAIQACEPAARRIGAKLLPLHGDLAPEQQDEAVAPSSVRKIICSTNVAESSITIDGVEAVVDSGLARVLTHSPWSGLSRLEVQRVSQSSAIQRAGRAGRTQAGIAIRLFSESDFVRRPKDLAPEIARSDLAPVLLQLAAAVLRWDELAWLQNPPAELVESAAALLQRLGALDSMLRVTELGRTMNRFQLHPRLARFMIEAVKLGSRREACDLAARLSAGRVRADVETAGRLASDVDRILALDIDYTTRRLRDQLMQAASSPASDKNDIHAVEKGLLVGFCDRAGRRRGDTILLSDGSSAKLRSAAVTQHEFLVAIEVEDRSQEGAPVVSFTSTYHPDWLLEYFPDRIEAAEELGWNREAERVEEVSVLRYDKLVVLETPSPLRDLQSAAAMLSSKALEAGLDKFVDVEELSAFLRRVRFAQEHAANLKIPADLVESSLRQLADGLTSFRQLRDAGLLSFLETQLPMRMISEIAPTHVILPSGRRAKIEYHDEQPPSVASRLQDFFGMTETPSVARGSVPLVVKLLAPNQRPMQVTRDLPSFWRNLYPQLRRELGRRYPKHAWPEDPTLLVRK